MRAGPRLAFVRVNQRMAEMNGVPAAEHIGKTVRDIVPSVADIAEPWRNRFSKPGSPS